MSERFEVFGDVIKDNEQIPNLLDNYQATIRLNEFLQRIAELEEQLKNAIVPKFKYHQVVYALYTDTDIFKGQIDVFDYYEQKYLVFFNDDIGSDWFCESELFKTKKEAQAKLRELQGE